jgi:hypothetical protein
LIILKYVIIFWKELLKPMRPLNFKFDKKKEKAGMHHVIMINWRLNSIHWSKKRFTKMLNFQLGDIILVAQYFVMDGQMQQIILNFKCSGYFS